MKDLTQLCKFLYAKVDVNKKLSDIRDYTYGQRFGTIASICKQYGIKYNILDNCVEFSAPRVRMQLFIEKLHFSGTKYTHKKI